MPRGGDGLPLLGAGVVAVAVVLGGAFDPDDRLAIAIAAAIVFGLAAAAASRSPSTEEWLALAVIGWGAVSAALVAGYPLAAKQTLGGWLVAWLVWLTAGRAPSEWRRSLGLVVAVAALVVAAAVVVECVGAGRLRMGGLFVNPNVAAALLVAAVPAVRSLLAGSERRGVVAALAAALSVGVLLTGSRAGLVALVVVAGLMLPRGRPRAAGLAALAAVAAGVLLWRFVGRPDSLAWHRIEIWRALWSLVIESPLVGVGPGWLEEATGVVRIAHDGGIARWGRVIGSAESTPFGLLVRTGMVGFGLALAAVAVWWRRSRRETATLARVTLVGIGLVALFHDLLDVDVVLWWWALLLGAVRPVVTEPESTAREVGLAARVPVGLATAFVVLWTVATPALARQLWWSGDSTDNLADRAQLVEPWFAAPVEWRVDQLLAAPGWSLEEAAGALSWSRRAADIHPGSARTWSRLGDVNARVATELGPWPDVLAGAREGFERATELEPHLPWTWLRWAVFERAVGQVDAARALAERAVAEEPSFVRGWLLLARLALDRGDPVAAGAAYDRARDAARLGGHRELTKYERDLLSASLWQVEDVANALERLDD
ncbi:MAG: tetratricopeptide repeat protein [Deltaproteobacteria bacterium]|jgi:O-antigen ligase|nr:tetratricopeptide repeat protein [Deltaproteobacteria bacterium]MBW2531796.1 tetratricopeptide repeat protein [Deltaproteobacteria bacterium]